MRNVLLAIALAPLLAGCPALDVMEGKESPYEAAHAQRMALLSPEPPAVLTELDVEPEAPEPVVATAPNDPWPVVVDTAPDCVPVFRVTTCD